MLRLVIQLASWGVIFAALLLASCDQTSVAPTNSAPAGLTAAQPVAPPAPVRTGFSLPIGGDIQPLPEAPRSIPSFASSGPSGGGNIPVPSLQSQSPRGAPSGTPQTHPIQLYAGIAVPQYLPSGTAIGISVDYQVAGSLNPSSRYHWVVKSGAGKSASEVQLESSGTLAAFFLELKPEHRPFSVWIEEVTPGSQRRVVISNELPLKTDY